MVYSNITSECMYRYNLMLEHYSSPAFNRAPTWLLAAMTRSERRSRRREASSINLSDLAAHISLAVRSPSQRSNKVILSLAMALCQKLTNLSSCWHNAVASSRSLSCVCLRTAERGQGSGANAIKRFSRSLRRSEGGAAAGPAWLNT